MEEELSGMDGSHGDVESRYRQELARERATRERLERQLNEIATENRRRREEAEEAERVSVIREGLEERGVKKTRLALRLVKDDIKRGDDGRLYGEADGRRVPLEDYLDMFVGENPEFLPPRIAGGSGATGTGSRELSQSVCQFESIRPGMSRDESREAWKQVARLMGSGDPRW
jgi:hypothetical protein